MYGWDSLVTGFLRGTDDVVHQFVVFMLGTSNSMFKVLSFLWFVIAGERSDYLFDDDVIWQIIGETSVVGATYKVIEIVGYTVEGLNMIRRIILGNRVAYGGGVSFESKLFLLTDETNDKWIASKKKKKPIRYCN